MCGRHPRTIFAFRAAYATVGILVGVSVCAVFGLHFGNTHAAFWGLASGVFAALALVQFVYFYVVKEIMGLPPNGYVLCSIALLASLAVGASIGGFVTYLTLGIMDSRNHNEPALIKSHYIVCVWCFMVGKWGVTSYSYALTSLKYLTLVGQGYAPISGSYDKL